MERERWYLPAAVGLLVFWSLFAVYVHQSTSMTDGHFMYVLDDAFIHAAVAKHIATDGVWSINDHGFAAASSSLLWPILLAGVFLVVDHYLVPLAFNLVFASLSVVTAAWSLGREGVHPAVIGATGIALVVFTPFVPLVYTGLEHHLHILLVLAVGYPAMVELTADDELIPHQWPILLAGSAALTATRYEAIFFVGIIGVLFVVRKRVFDAAILAGTGAVPILVYGLFSRSHGGPFLPNPIRLKGSTEFLGWIPLLMETANHLRETPHLLVLFGIASSAFVVLALSDFWRPAPLLIGLFTGTTVAHLAFASTGWFFRYEAYLVAFGTIVCVIGIHRIFEDHLEGVAVPDSMSVESMAVIIAVLLVTATVASPMAIRAKNAHEHTPQASENIYDQQFQIARFLSVHYRGQSVAANDIGAINYYADVETVDLAGLGTDAVARAMIDREYSTDTVESLSSSHDVQVAVVYDHWFRDGEFFPDSWTKVGEWTIQDNVLLAGSTVSFYAVNEDPQALATKLCTHSSQLPSDVETSGPYTRMDTCRGPLPLDEGERDG